MKNLRKLLSLAMVVFVLISMFACKSNNEIAKVENSEADGKVTYKVGICNYVDDASLNQIVANIRSRFAEIEKENNCNIEILYDNCNADSNVLSQIVSNFISEKVDLMIGIATPVAMNMQNATEFDKIPVIFSAVSDPLSCNLVEKLDRPGSNISGTSDYLDTKSLFKLIFELNSDIGSIGLLYDAGQDSSTTAISTIKEYIDAMPDVSYEEKTGTNVSEVSLAVDSLIESGVEAIFTPTDNTIMTAELSIYEKLKDANIPHFCGADSFALNGAFLGYGVDYANLGRETADMAKEVLIDKKDISTMPVRTFDNGTATINTEVCDALGYDFDEVKDKFLKHCTNVVKIETAKEFN